MKIDIQHTTRYFYDEPVTKSIQYLRVTPQTLAHQKVLEWTLTLPRFGEEIFDGFGNFCTILSLNEQHDGLTIQAGKATSKSMTMPTALPTGASRRRFTSTAPGSPAAPRHWLSLPKSKPAAAPTAKP